VLPSNATVRLWLGAHLRDLFGESSHSQAPALVGTFATETAYEPQFDAIALDLARTPLAAPDFGDVAAVVVDGALRVPAAFQDLVDVGDWEPDTTDLVLRTDVQTLRYTSGALRTFEGGVLQMRNLNIRQGQVVRATGPHALVLVVDGDARIDGHLLAGGASATNQQFGQYRGVGDVVPPVLGGGSLDLGQATPGPHGGPTGGSGGSHAFLGPLHDDAAGQSAAGTVGAGGAAGAVGCNDCTRSAGGGGGAMATAGDPWYPTAPGAGTGFVQRTGQGGFGCAGSSGAITRTLAGGAMGNPLFRDADAGNDFWGIGYEPRHGTRRAGELAAPRGGSGGGAGGNYDYLGACEATNAFSVLQAGAGGGGGGVIVLQVRGTLTISSTGRIGANGGNGNRSVRYIDHIGGGGGGAGGTIVLMAGRGIVLHTHGETFANQDYDFVLSADGGICTTDNFQAPFVTGKYPANGQPTIAGSTYDSGPLGGFGGLGSIQLMVPPGTGNLDLTNTVLDDAITIVHNGLPLQGADKQRFLGWRGFPDDAGNLVDDFGNLTNTIGGQGDMRPDPVLLPVPFTSHGRARARTGWLPLGARLRRQLSAPDGLARAVLGEPMRFANPGRSDGWLPYADGHLTAGANGTALLPAPATIVAHRASDLSLGQPLAAVELEHALPEPARDAYAGCVAEFRMAQGGSHARLQVLGSLDDTLFFAAGTVLPSTTTHLQLHATHAEFAVPEPARYVGAAGVWLPRSNARVGFAFHRAPDLATANGADPNRYPPHRSAFVHDLTDPAVVADLRLFRPTHLQVDLLLDGEFRTSVADLPPAGEAAATVALRRLWLPVRF
jgi:hypothetical protein